MQQFWQQHPALLYGIAALIGVSGAVYQQTIFILPLGLLIVPLLFALWRQLLLALLVSASFFWYAYAPPSPLLVEISGTAHISISSLSLSSTHFGRQYLYRGILQSFSSNERTIDLKSGAPFTLTLPANGTLIRPPANCDYVLTCRLKESNTGGYILFPDKKAAWNPVVGSWSIAEMRFQAKQGLEKYIRNHIHETRAAAFLNGIATGNFDDRVMAYELGRFGLQHIMAISGFHFAITASILSILLRLVFQRKAATLFLAVVLSAYFVFLGTTPSIMRAWGMAMIGLGGVIFHRQGVALNSLGVSLIVLLFFNPLHVKNLGFQFSFATTAAILLLFRPCDYALQDVFAKRSLSQMVKMDKVNQHGYCLLAFFRQGIALTLAVNSIAIPLLFLYFHKFPILSLFYNLFFPFLVSISMILLIFSSLCYFIPLLSEFIHSVNTIYTQNVLNLIYNMPSGVDVVWQVSLFSSEIVIVYGCALFILAVYLRDWLVKRQESLQGSLSEFSFI